MPKLGRAFNHLDDLPILFGMQGLDEAIRHLMEFKTKEGYSSIRTKWDGRVQVYWGRCAEGKFHLAPHHVWERKEECTSKDRLRNAFLNSRGGTRDEIQWVSKRFEVLYDILEKETPLDFRGFVYGDAITLEQPTTKDGIISFKGNLRSETVYYTTTGSEIGAKLKNAEFIIVGHGTFGEWGSSDKKQKPLDDFSFASNNPSVVVLNPEYNTRPLKVKDDVVRYISSLADRHFEVLESFTSPVEGLADFPDLLYRFVNHKCRYKKQYEINARNMIEWVKSNNKLTESKISRFCDHSYSHPSALEILFTIVNAIREEKDRIITQLERSTGEIWATNGEGYVRYAEEHHKCGNIKLVPRWRWIPQ